MESQGFSAWGRCGSDASLLESRGAVGGTGAPKRMVAVNFPLGFHGPNFFPEQTGRDCEL